MKKHFLILIFCVCIKCVNAQTSPDYTVVTTPPSCSTCCDGTATVTILNSSCTIYGVIWSNGVPTLSIENCCYGITYSVSISGACGTETLEGDFGEISTNIKYTSDDFKTIIYPNPSGSKIHIEAKEVTEIKLFDLLGNEVLTVSKENDVDVSNLNGGVYFIEVNRKQGVSTEKIIVQH